MGGASRILLGRLRPEPLLHRAPPHSPITVPLYRTVPHIPLLLWQGVYRAFSSNAKFVNATSLPQINFMAAAVIEMYGVNTGACRGCQFGRVQRLVAATVGGAWAAYQQCYRRASAWLLLRLLPECLAFLLSLPPPLCSRLVPARLQLHPPAGGAAAVGADQQEQGGVPRGVLLAGEAERGGFPLLQLLLRWLPPGRSLMQPCC